MGISKLWPPAAGSRQQQWERNYYREQCEQCLLIYGTPSRLCCPKRGVEYHGLVCRRHTPVAAAISSSVPAAVVAVVVVVVGIRDVHGAPAAVSAADTTDGCDVHVDSDYTPPPSSRLHLSLPMMIPATANGHGQTHWKYTRNFFMELIIWELLY